MPSSTSKTDEQKKIKAELSDLKRENSLRDMVIIEKVIDMEVGDNDMERERELSLEVYNYKVAVKTIIKEKPKNQQFICIIFKTDKEGYVVSYSIGSNSFSNNFHDISHLKMKRADFHKAIVSAIHSERSINGVVRAIENKFPGQKNFIDSAAQAKANTALKDFMEESRNAGHSITPFSTTPKPKGSLL